MAKKKQSKKHNFKYAAPTTAPAAPTVSGVVVSKPVTGSGQSPAMVTGAYAYVGRDVTKVGLFATGLIVLEILLWWLFGHTGLGNALYNLIKV